MCSPNCKSGSPVVYSTDRSKAVVPVLVLLFVALWFILQGDLFYVLPCCATGTGEGVGWVWVGEGGMEGVVAGSS